MRDFFVSLLLRFAFHQKIQPLIFSRKMVLFCV
jgi:hypothetical protein